MLALALLAIPLGAWAECLKRRSRFLSLASSHAAEACDGRITPPSQRATMSPAELDASSDRRLAWEEYHEALAAKYTQAARSPWLPVPDDPPEPR